MPLRWREDLSCEDHGKVIPPDYLSRIILRQKIKIEIYVVIGWIAFPSFLRFCLYLTPTNYSAKLRAEVGDIPPSLLSRAHTEPLPSSNSHSPSQYFSCPKSAQGQVRDNWGQPLCPSACQNYSNKPILSCFLCCVLPFPWKTLAHASSFLFCLMTCPGASSYGPAWHGVPLISRGTVDNLKLLFPWH